MVSYPDSINSSIVLDGDCVQVWLFIVKQLLIIITIIWAKGYTRVW